MVYDKKQCYGDGQWHCPFPRDWIERMKQASKSCHGMTSEYIEMVMNKNEYHYRVPPGDFLDKPQDARGLPVGYGDGLGRDVRCDIYDYDSIPDVVISNGHDDYPLRIWEQVLTA